MGGSGTLDGRYFNGTNTVQNYGGGGGQPVSGSSPVGQQARNNPQGRAVFGAEGQQYRDILQSILSQGDAQYNSDVAYQQQQGYLNALGYQQQMDALRQQLGIAGGQSGIAKANNDIDMAALMRQYPLLDAYNNLDKNDLQRQMESLFFNYNQNNAGFDQKQQQLDYSKLRQTQDANTGADNAWWNARSDATARGAMASAGAQRSYSSIQDQLQKSLGDIDKSYGWNVADLKRAREANEFNTKQGYGAGMDAAQRTELGYNESKSKLDDDKKRLENAAKSIGLSAAETSSRINAQLSKLGIDSIMNTNDVLKGLEDLRNNRVTNLSQALSAMQQMYGIDFNQLAGSQ